MPPIIDRLRALVQTVESIPGEYTGPISLSITEARTLLAYVQEWIACSDRLPKNGVLVLYFYHGEIEIAEWRQTGHDQVWHEVNTDEVLAAPTHWMPLPAPPIAAAKKEET